MKKAIVLFSFVTRNGHVWLICEGHKEHIYAGLASGKPAPNKGDEVMIETKEKGCVAYW